MAGDGGVTMDRIHALLAMATVAMLLVAVDAQEKAPADPVRGRATFVAAGCHSCHDVAEDPALPRVARAMDGPLLRNFGDATAEDVTWRIVARTKLDASELYESEMAESVSSLDERQLAGIVAYLRDPAAGIP